MKSQPLVNLPLHSAERGSQVNGLDEVGRGERAANWVGVIQEGEVVIPFFADFAHEERGARLKMLAQVLERGGGDRGVPGRLQGADTRMEFGGLGFAQGTLGIALQMNDAEKEWKTQEASFPLFPPRLEIRPTTPDSHIPTTPAAMIISRHNFQATPVQQALMIDPVPAKLISSERPKS
jgi:hypothetical protein